jgi:hypothetical protein
MAPSRTSSSIPVVEVTACATDPKMAEMLVPRVFSPFPVRRSWIFVSHFRESPLSLR